ncbi:MAG: GNAT family N-acetyltransferase [Actinomycetes bacterium]
MATTDDVTVRRATDADLPEILALAGRSLGWEAGAATEAHFAWKHLENPFGRSPMWVAESAGRLAGFRTFLRWEFAAPDGSTLRVVRAVDTATDPGFQGRGIFTTLTRGALEELRADGVAFVFNTPNAQSRPGYLKMGWRVIATLPVAMRPTHLGGLATIARARTPADRGALPTDCGTPAAEVFADARVASSLLAHVAPVTALHTHRTPEFLAWRYGPAALHYRVVGASTDPADGAVVIHLRRRGPAVEAVVADVFAPDARSARAALGRVARASGADYLVRLRAPGDGGRRAGFWPVPRVGPTLTARAVSQSPPTALAAWRLTMGDIEIF